MPDTKHEERKEQREPRIAVIGAGPAGLGVAHYLKWLGYAEVMVFEKLARVGGLCKSITDGYRPFDMGGTYISPAYHETLALARSVGAERYRGRKYQPILVGDGGKIEELPTERWVRSGAGWSSFLLGILRFWWERAKVRRYVDSPIFEGVHGGDEKGRELCVSFRDWLESKKLGHIANLFDIPVTMMGYGFLDEVAAPYVLKYMSSGMLWSMVLRGLPVIEWFFSWPHRFDEGFERLWQRVAWGLNVRTDVEVEEITREGGPDLPVRIRLAFKDRIHPHDLGRSETTLYFDKLIIACPLTPDVLGAVFAQGGTAVASPPPDPLVRLDAPHARGIRNEIDLSEDELALFAKIKTFTYVQTTAHAIVREERDGQLREKPFRLLAPVVPVFPFSRETLGRPWVVVQVWGEDSRLLQFYSRVDPPENETHEQEIELKNKVEAHARKLLQHLGGEVAGSTNERLRRWETYDRWPYFGYVEPTDIRDGFFRDLEQLQGRRNTYYAGGAATFEMVESILCHAKYVAHKVDDDLRAQRFRAPKRTAPGPWAHPVAEGI